MMLFLMIREGKTADDAEPLVVTADQDLIAAVGAALANRLGATLPAAPLVLLKLQNPQGTP